MACRRGRSKAAGGDAGSERCAEIGGQLVEVDAACFQLEPDRVGPAGDQAESGQLLAAAAAQLCAERVAGILQHPVEQVLWPDTGVAAAGSEPVGELQGAFGQQVDAQRVGAGVAAAPPAPAPDPPLGCLQRSRAEGCLQALPYLLGVDAQRPQRNSRAGARSRRGSRRRNPACAAARSSPCAASMAAAPLLPWRNSPTSTCSSPMQGMSSSRASANASRITCSPSGVSRGHTAPVPSSPIAVRSTPVTRSHLTVSPCGQSAARACNGRLAW